MIKAGFVKHIEGTVETTGILRTSVYMEVIMSLQNCKSYVCSFFSRKTKSRTST
jgi:hypothetical protein